MHTYNCMYDKEGVCVCVCVCVHVCVRVCVRACVRVCVCVCVCVWSVCQLSNIEPTKYCASWLFKQTRRSYSMAVFSVLHSNV